MAELPIMPVATDAILSDTSDMTAEQFGAYCRLLFVMWRHAGRLPNDPDKLARIAGVPLQRWHLMSAPVMSRMMHVGREITQKKLLEMWESVANLKSRKQNAALARWEKAKSLENIRAVGTGAYATSMQPLTNKNITSSFLTAATPQAPEPPEPPAKQEAGEMAEPSGETPQPPQPRLRSTVIPPPAPPGITARDGLKAEDLPISPELEAILRPKKGLGYDRK